MRNLLLILLFIPLISFGQVYKVKNYTVGGAKSEITYQDIMSINSSQQFERVFIEKNFEKIDEDDKDFITYFWGRTKTEVIYPLQFDEDAIGFGINFSYEFDYNRLFEIVKEKCDFAFVTEGISNYICSDERETIIGFKSRKSDLDIYTVNIIVMKSRT